MILNWNPGVQNVMHNSYFKQNFSDLNKSYYCKKAKCQRKQSLSGFLLYCMAVTLVQCVIGMK